MTTPISKPIHILADATLPQLTRLFPSPFQLTRYNTHDQMPTLLTDHEILLCRSTLRIDAALLANSAIRCIATASSGIDHIDEAYLKQHHIALFDAKGSNARAVADYVVATLAALQRLGVSTGHLAGVIGIGEVGSRVVARLEAAGFQVICYDPFKDPQGSRYHYGTLEDLTACDLLCLHPNLHATPPFPSKHLIDARFLNQLKSGVVIINASRGSIVDEEALLASNKPMLYCTDVYRAEPSINPRIIDFATLCTPHIAGHSIEAKQAAVVQISQHLHQHYGLTSPSVDSPMSIPHAFLSPTHHWADRVLSLYNPMEETQRLKTAVDKKEAFLILRKAHQFRHDFNRYALPTATEQMQRLFA